MSAPIVACVLASVLYGVGAVLQGAGARRCQADSSVKGLATIVGQGPYLAGLACDLVAWGFTMYAIHHLPQFAVQTTLAGSVAVTALLAWGFLRCPLRARDGLAIGLGLVGLVLVGLAAGPVHDRGAQVTTETVLTVVVPFGAFLGVVVVRRSGPVARAAVAGLLFSLGAASARTLELSAHPMALVVQPTAWAVVGYVVAGLVVHARSLEGGKVGPVTAALWSSEILVAAAAGFVLFGDRVRPGAMWTALLGVTLSLGATVLLATSPSHADAVAA